MRRTNKIDMDDNHEEQYTEKKIETYEVDQSKGTLNDKESGVLKRLKSKTGFELCDNRRWGRDNAMEKRSM